MSLKTFGEQSEEKQLQPGWTIAENPIDQTLIGQCVFVCTEAYATGRNFKGGEKHPKDQRLKLSDFTIEGNKAGKCNVICNYFGLLATPTRPIYSYFNATNEEPIEAHPDFSTFAGDVDNPEPGAEFDSNTGEFLGFSSGDFIGVRGFLDGKPVIRKTWYTDNVTEGIEDIMKIKSLPSGAIPGLTSGSNTLKTNWGSTAVGFGFYQVWEEYSISGRNGWNDTIYKSL